MSSFTADDYAHQVYAKRLTEATEPRLDQAIGKELLPIT